METRYTFDWEVGHSADKDSLPEKWVPATVPGAVQLDWAKATNMADYNFGDNHREYRWMEDRFWTYRTQINIPESKRSKGQRIFFVSKGIDYRCEIRINDKILHSQEGLSLIVELDITDYCGKNNELFVTIWPIPKSISDEECRQRYKWQADQSTKPAVSYEWDFHPRLVPLGIWDDTYIELRPACHLQSAELSYSLSTDHSSADISVAVVCSSSMSGAQIRWQLCAYDGTVVLEKSAALQNARISLSSRFDNPRLWWPNGQGDPYLYCSKIAMLDASGTVIDEKESRVGFRRVALVMQPGAWKEPSRYPMTRSTPPITLEINGRPVFAKGSNWVCPDIFPGAVTEETLRAQVALAHDAHMNIFRCWGGASVMKEKFFDLCDESGIMVWQEFPLACNNYQGSPAYLSLLDRDSRSIINRLKSHASVVLWCGGNELFNHWSGMTDQSLAIRLLNRNTFELDPFRPFLPTSPVMGMAHGSYSFRVQNEGEVFEIFRNSSYNAYTEFGTNGPAFADTIRRVLPPQDSYPLAEGASFSTDRAKRGLPPIGRMNGCGVAHYFPAPATLDELVEKGQMLQGIGLQCIFEETRRQKPRCSMAVNWCFNEPWPCIANCSIIEWPSRPKPAVSYVKQSLRPVLASARIPKFSWTCEETFETEMWILSDNPEAVPAGKLFAKLRFGKDEMNLAAWEFDSIPANTNLRGPTCRCVLPQSSTEMFELILEVDGHSEWNSLYRLRLNQPVVHENILRPRITPGAI